MSVNGAKFEKNLDGRSFSRELPYIKGYSNWFLNFYYCIDHINAQQLFSVFKNNNVPWSSIQWTLISKEMWRQVKESLEKAQWRVHSHRKLCWIVVILTRVVKMNKMRDHMSPFIFAGHSRIGILKSCKSFIWPRLKKHSRFSRRWVTSVRPEVWESSTKIFDLWLPNWRTWTYSVVLNKVLISSTCQKHTPK